MWLVIYELVYVIALVIVGLLLLHSHRAYYVRSSIFGKSHDMLSVVLHIWLNNVTSFLIGAVFVILHPALGVLMVVFTSVSSSKLFASWLAGHSNTAHPIYKSIVAQVYILMWLAVVKMYYAQKECNTLTCRWSVTVKETSQILVYAFTTFLALALVEVAEIHVFS